MIFIDIMLLIKRKKNLMKKSVLFLFVGLFFIASCKKDPKVKTDDKAQSAPVTSVNKVKSDGDVNKNEDGTELAPLYNPCSLISVEELADILNISPGQIKVKPTSSSGSFSRSCFLSWENMENGAKNSMFLMLQTDPIPGDFEDWAKSFIEAKITNGDMGYPDTETPYKYEPVEEIEGLSAYNDELRRVFWKFDKDYVMAIFYNAGLTTKNRKDYAVKISKIMNKNMRKKIK